MKLRLHPSSRISTTGGFVPTAVESMSNQSRLADEFILVDEASTTGSQRVVE